MNKITVAWFAEAIRELPDDILDLLLDDVVDEIIRFGFGAGYLSDASDLDEWRREISGFVVDMRHQKLLEDPPAEELLVLTDLIAGWSDDECAAELATALELNLADEHSRLWVSLLRQRVGS